ncbi:DUF4350 domain-containing protein [Desulfococcaceae bacterium HSG8]|nr:DUF4350 domain-containing protein [Desulfococcaceae bacterium HSG8]
MYFHGKISVILMFAVFAAFIMGVVELFSLGFERGDMYPAYSSLRSDPLGTKGFCESLENLPDVSIIRNFRPLSEMPGSENTTFFYLGAQIHQLMFINEDQLKSLERLAAEGGRLIFSFFPVKEKQMEKKVNKSELKITPFFPITTRWGINFAYLRYNGKNRTYLKKADIRDASSGNSLPPSVPWHTALYFDEPPAPWKVIYEREGRPVIIEKPFGRGQIIFCSDSYFFSNEALQKERNPELLAWLMGKNTRVIFDEYHFGIQETPGLVALAIEYRLHGALWGIILLAVLFIWKHATYFVPPRDDEYPEGNYGLSSERDYTEGLISLLKRNIPKQDILEICVKEWEKNTGERVSDHKRERIKAVSSTADPVKGYQTICYILSEKNSPDFD